MNMHLKSTDSRSPSGVPSNRRAAILTLFVFLLPVLIILLGFSIDMAYMQLVNTELRMATDNAARAAADEFARSEDERAAQTAGIQMARSFQVGGTRLRLRRSDFDFGRSTPQPDGTYLFDTNGFPPNSVRLAAARDSQSRDGSVSLFFGNFLGIYEFEPQAATTATFVNVDICLVLDRSTSMKFLMQNGISGGMSINDPNFCQPPRPDTRWLALESAVKVFTSVLEENYVEEQVGVVTYGSDLNTILPGLCGREPNATVDIGLTTNLSLIDDEVEDRSNSVWNGNTEIASGIQLATNELLNGSGARQYADKVMIVLTDGVPTDGDAVAAAGVAANNSIRVYTITFSDGADEQHMKDVAAAGGGEHRHAVDEDELKEVFREFAAAATKITE